MNGVHIHGHRNCFSLHLYSDTKDETLGFFRIINCLITEVKILVVTKLLIQRAGRLNVHNRG